MIVQLSPARPLSDTIPAAPTPGGNNFTKWSFRSYRGTATGITVKLIIGADGSTPNLVWIGFNRQPPALMQLQDAYEYPLSFRSVEIYNNSNTAWTITGTVYNGELTP